MCRSLWRWKCWICHSLVTCDGERRNTANCKQESNVSLNDGVVTKWPFNLIISLIQPIKFVMAECQSLQGICNHDNRRLPHASRVFVQIVLFQLYYHFLSLACWVFRCLMPPLCYRHKSDIVCNKTWSFHGCLNRNLFSKKTTEIWP